MAEGKREKRERQKRLWHEIVHRALRRWNLPPGELRWLKFNGKAVAKVQTAAGAFVLRLYPPGSVNKAALRSELRWLSFIRRKTDLLAPFPLAAPVDGHEQFCQDVICGAQTVIAAVFQFIEGDMKLACDLTAKDVFAIGEYLGKLRRDAQFDPPSDFERPRLDWEGLFGDSSPYASPGETELLSAEQRAIFADVADHMRGPLAALSAKPEAMGLIHADLLAKNIIYRDDSPAALDFEFCGTGFFLYDLAPLLWQLKGERAEDYVDLEEALWRGYCSIRPVAESERDLLETFIAARQLASCRWLLANMQNQSLREIAPPLIRQRCDELKSYLDSGILRRSSPTL
ncbi:MAG: phosphotransferase [Chloroflexota bacterium]|nr:phosphotransferase [Chloroflexota bacterium]MDE2945905.1 phosphotransferase [Chloroflexota bacterium]